MKNNNQKTWEKYWYMNGDILMTEYIAEQEPSGYRRRADINDIKSLLASQRKEILGEIEKRIPKEVYYNPELAKNEYYRTGYFHGQGMAEKRVLESLKSKLK